MSAVGGLSGTKVYVSGGPSITILPEGFIRRCSVCARDILTCKCAPADAVVAPESGTAFGASERKGKIVPKFGTIGLLVKG